MKKKLTQECGVCFPLLFAYVVTAALMTGCATTPTPEPQAQGTAFYPPLPNPPRIQHLKTITGERDLGAPVSGIAKFVLGDEAKTQQLQQPYGVGVYAGKLYVVDSRAGGLAVFDLVQQRFELLNGAPNGRMKRPINITIDSDGTKYVTDTGRDQILVFDRGQVVASGTHAQLYAGNALYQSLYDRQHSAA